MDVLVPFVSLLFLSAGLGIDNALLIEFSLKGLNMEKRQHLRWRSAALVLAAVKTEFGKFGEVLKICQEIEASEGGLAAGINIGNPFTDTPDLQSNIFVTTDNDPARAEREALRLARFMWQYRQLFVADLTPLADAVRLAEETDGLTRFFNDDKDDPTKSGAYQPQLPLSTQQPQRAQQRQSQQLPPQNAVDVARIDIKRRQTDGVDHENV